MMDSEDSGTALLPQEKPAAETDGKQEPKTESATPTVDGLADSVRRYLDGPQFGDTRQKVSAQLHQLAKEFDELQGKLLAEINQAATEARQVVNQEIATLKAEHPEALSHIGELIGLGKEGVGLADAKIGKLAQDLTSAVERFLADLGTQPKPDKPADKKEDQKDKPPGADVS